jgi:tetratricopeptide (TPR) repeat protein
MIAYVFIFSLFILIGCGTSSQPKRSGPPPSTKTASPTYRQIEVLSRDAKKFPPIEVQKQMVAQIEEVAGPDSPALTAPLTNIGKDYLDKGNFSKAEAIFQRVLLIDTKHNANNFYYLALDKSNLALTKCYEQKFGEAETLAQDATGTFYRATSSGFKVNILQENAALFDKMSTCCKKFGKESEAKKYEKARDAILQQIWKRK